MIFVIENTEFANITFNGNARVSLLGESMYLVKWYVDGKFVGEMELHPGCWGAFPLIIGNWIVEFWKDGRLVSSYENSLSGETLLLVPKFSNPSPGKIKNLKDLSERAEFLYQTYNCKIICYFPNSERYNLPPHIIPYRMNDNYNFKLMIEEWIA